MRNHCQQARQWLSAKLDGELSESRRVWLDQHLTACGDCRRFTVRLAELAQTLPAAVADPGAVFTQRVLARLPDRHRGLRGLRLRLALAAVVSLCAGLWLGLGVAPSAGTSSDQMTEVVQATFAVLPANTVAGRYLTPVGEE